eukprot:jgi/Bigna1/126075/aug1.2_g783
MEKMLGPEERAFVQHLFGEKRNNTLQNHGGDEKRTGDEKGKYPEEEEEEEARRRFEKWKDYTENQESRRYLNDLAYLNPKMEKKLIRNMYRGAMRNRKKNKSDLQILSERYENLILSGAGKCKSFELTDRSRRKMNFAEFIGVDLRSFETYKIGNKKANDTDIAVNAKEMEAAFEALAGCATIESGRIMTIDPTSNQGVTKISVINAQKDPKLNKSSSNTIFYFMQDAARFSVFLQNSSSRYIHSSSSAAFQSTPPVPLGKAIATIPSPSGKLFLSIYSDESGAEQQSISSTYTFVISDAAENLHTIRSKGLHKQIFLKGNLGGISWSLDETKIVYVAEPKATETSHFFSSDKDKKNGLGEKGLKDVQEGKDVTAPAGKDESKGSPFEFSEHWGEIMTKATSPKPFLIDIRLESVIPFKGAPKNVSFGQVQFCPDGKSMYELE